LANVPTPFRHRCNTIGFIVEAPLQHHWFYRCSPLQRRLLFCNGAIEITIGAIAKAVFKGKI